MSGLFPQRLKTFVQRLGGAGAAATLGPRLRPGGVDDNRRFTVRRGVEPEGVAQWWQGRSEQCRAALASEQALATLAGCCGNIENAVGMVALPLGVAGPVRVNGLHAQGDYVLPLATTEAALVASYARGAHAITQAGGAAAALLGEAVLRTPAFVFPTMVEAGSFVAWLTEQEAALRTSAEATTRHGRLESIEPLVDNDIVFLVCRYTTGDASGQNMVTIATDAMCRWILDHTPYPPVRWFVEGNFSGDKKASYLGLLTGRGRKVSASVVLPPRVVERVLRVSIDDMLAYARVARLGAALSGQIGDDEIQVAGGHVVQGYLDPDDDAATKLRDADGTIWHRTGDGGRFDALGRLWLRGRLAGRAGGLWPFEIEVAARGWPGVRRCALVPVDGLPVLAIEGDARHAAAWQANAATLDVARIVTLAKLPLDRRHRSKIDYASLGAQVAKASGN